MKFKFSALLLTCILAIGLSACTDGSIQGITGAGTSQETAEEDDSVVIPAAVENLSEEDDVLLNGELQDGVYINNYFGYKLTVPQGWMLTRLNDDATSNQEVIPLKKAYEEGWGGLYYYAENDETDSTIEFFITALGDDEIGLTEEELIEKYIEPFKEINSVLGDDDAPENTKVVFAGEEHPAAVSYTEIEDGSIRTDAHFRIPKDGFEFYVTISGTDIDLEEMTSCFEKL